MNFREYITESNIWNKVDSLRSKKGAEEFIYQYLDNKYPEKFDSDTMVDDVLEDLSDSELKDLYKEMKKAL